VELVWLLLVALAVGVLVGFFVGRIGGTQEEEAAPSPPRTVTVEETVQTTVEKTVPAPPTPDTPQGTDTATATAYP
jgi:hypothetical protein